MSFRHVVMFQWAEGLGDEHVRRVRDGLNALPSAIEQIRSYVHGPDLGVTEGNFDYVLVADFDSEEDFLVYRSHPVHLQFIADVITGNTANRAAVQYAT
jgi:hypothetical protein